LSSLSQKLEASASRDGVARSARTPGSTASSSCRPYTR